jgi:hypothetical protein
LEAHLGRALEAHYQFLAWLVPMVEKSPKSHKLTIGRSHQEHDLHVPEAAERGYHGGALSWLGDAGLLGAAVLQERQARRFCCGA